MNSFDVFVIKGFTVYETICLPKQSVQNFFANI